MEAGDSKGIPKTSTPRGKWGPLGEIWGRCEWENILYHTVSCSGCPPIFEDIHRQLRPFLTGAQSFPGPSPASHINCEHDAIVLILGFNWIDPLFLFGNLRHPVQNSSIRDVWIRVTEFKSQWWFHCKIFQVRCLKSLGWWFKYPRTILAGDIQIVVENQKHSVWNHHLITASIECF
jgi:hypothetical protein